MIYNNKLRNNELYFAAFPEDLPGPYVWVNRETPKRFTDESMRFLTLQEIQEKLATGLGFEINEELRHDDDENRFKLSDE